MAGGYGKMKSVVDLNALPIHLIHRERSSFYLLAFKVDQPRHQLNEYCKCFDKMLFENMIMENALSYKLEGKCVISYYRSLE